MDSANVLHTAQRVAQAKAVLEEAASARRADAAARASGRVQLQAALRAASTDEQRTQLLRTFEDSSRLAARAARKRVTVSDFEVRGGAQPPASLLMVLHTHTPTPPFPQRS